MAEPEQAAGPEVWARVEDYITGTLMPHDPALAAALDASREAGLPPIQVPANLGSFLHLLARIRGAHRILEIGTLGGYSTICLARALPPDGRLTTLEIDPTYAALARRNLERAAVSERVEIRVGPAAESLARLEGEGAEPFDLVFIDADKPSTPLYFQLSLRLARRGTVIVVDNVVRAGAVADPASRDASVQGIRRFNELAAAEPRVHATAIQTVGSKGYDGFALLVVTEDA